MHPDGSRFVHPMPIEFEGKVSDLLKQLQEQVTLIINTHSMQRKMFSCTSNLVFVHA